MDVIRGAYEVVGAEIPLVGGCAGDDLKMRRTYQLFGDRVLNDAIVAAAISSDGRSASACNTVGVMSASRCWLARSNGNRVESLDDQPALDVYLRRLDAPAEAGDDPRPSLASRSTHPLGITRRNGAEVRFVAEADFEDRSLGCIASLPQGGLAWIMEGDEDSVLDCDRRSLPEALAGLGGIPPLGMLAFDCIARRGVLGARRHQRRNRADRQVRRHDAPVAGFYTYGEIARTTGRQGFHNQTLVVLALG